MARLDRWLAACLADHDPATAPVVATFAWGLQVQHRAGVPVPDLQERVAHLVATFRLP